MMAGLIFRILPIILLGSSRSGTQGGGKESGLLVTLC